LWELVAELATGGGERRERLASHRGWSVASPVLAIALVPLFCNWTSASRAKHRATRDMAADLLNSVEPYGVLITVGDNDTFPLWYAQEVEGIRRDVVVAETSLLNTDWYVRQLIRRPIYAYDAAKGPAIYRNQNWTKPSKPPLDMTLVEADSVPPYYGLTGPMVFTAGPLHATIDPDRSKSELDEAEQAAARHDPRRGRLGAALLWPHGSDGVHRWAAPRDDRS